MKWLLAILADALGIGAVLVFFWVYLRVTELNGWPAIVSGWIIGAAGASLVVQIWPARIIHTVRDHLQY